jgi:hypothetical protein
MPGVIIRLVTTGIGPERDEAQSVEPSLIRTEADNSTAGIIRQANKRHDPRGSV